MPDWDAEFRVSVTTLNPVLRSDVAATLGSHLELGVCCSRPRAVPDASEFMRRSNECQEHNSKRIQAGKGFSGYSTLARRRR